MSIDVLLINPPWSNREEHIYSKVGATMPPLGLAQIASVLREEEISVSIIDGCLLKSRDELVSSLSELQPKIIGISATTSTITSAKDVVHTAKKTLPNSKIVLGGVHPSIFPEETAKIPGVTCVVRGEGEATALELAKKLLSEKSITDVKGITISTEEGVFSTPSRPLIPDLDSLPRPAYDLLPIRKYKPAYGTYNRLPAISMVTSRGCPGVCTFCFKSMFGTKIRSYSPEKILENIEYLQQEFGIREIIFYDDTFTVLKNNVSYICDGIKSRGIDLTWSCMARVDYVNKNILSKMASAGCRSVGFGVESANKKILKNICKQISLERVRGAIKDAQKSNIETRAFFMFGNPGETCETMNETIDFAIDLDPDIALFNITTPFPGTSMYRWAEKNGYLTTKDWSRYDCSEPVMNLPTVSAEEVLHYYKLAYRRFYLRPSYFIKRASRIRGLEDVRVGIQSVLGLLKHQ